MLITLHVNNVARSSQPSSITQELSLPLMADTYIASGNPDQRRGSISVIWVGYKNDGLQERRALLKFDATQIPPNAIIQEATLQLTVAGTTENASGLAVTGTQIKDDFVEDTNWAEYKSLQHGAASAPISVDSTRTSHNWDVTALVEEWQYERTIPDSIGFLLSGPSLSNTNRRSFWSKDCGLDCSEADKPGLVINYILPVPPILKINEFMVSNRSSYCDADDTAAQDCYDDWIEIYNLGLTPVDMRALYLTDDPNTPDKFQFTESVIVPSMESVIIWADAETSQGPTHTNFQLELADLSVSLYAQDGITLIDSLGVPFLTTDTSFGRYPDGTDKTYEFEVATPEKPNQIGLIFEQVMAEPQPPTSSDVVTITARFFEDARLDSAQLYYNTNASWSSVGFERRDNGDYKAAIPAQSDGTYVRYYIRAESTTGKVFSQPQWAPVELFDYLIGYQKPSVIINELVAGHDPLAASDVDSAAGASWFELYNPGNTPVQVEGMYLSDNPNIPRKYRIPSRLLIPAGAYMVFYANATSEFSPWHTNFTLDRNGGMLALYDTDANQNRLIDSHNYTSQSTDFSEYRCPTSFGIWNSRGVPTPGYINEPNCSIVFLPIID